jgi:hypothetical protein
MDFPIPYGAWFVLTGISIGLAIGLSFIAATIRSVDGRVGRGTIAAVAISLLVAAIFIARGFYPPTVI